MQEITRQILKAITSGWYGLTTERRMDTTSLVNKLDARDKRTFYLLVEGYTLLDIGGILNREYGSPAATTQGGSAAVNRLIRHLNQYHQGEIGK